MNQTDGHSITKEDIKIIDIHTHLFNLKYLPIAGILVRYGGGIISPKIAFTIEHFFIKNTKSIFEAEEEIFFNSKINKPIMKRLHIQLDEGTEKAFVNLEFKHIKNGLLNEITEVQIRRTVAQEGLIEFQEIALQEGLIRASETIDFSIFQLESNFTEVVLSKLMRLIDHLIDWICEKVDKIRNYIKWFRFMQKSEEETLHYLMEKDAVGVELYIHHLMDVDFYFNSLEEPQKYRSHFNFKDEQITNMQRLNEMYKDKIYAFVAFDPSKPDGVDIVKDAILNKGFKGVKFYPPLGYKAFNDPHFKENIELLFDFCIEMDVPLFSHCNNAGFEAHKKDHSGYNSYPMFWYKILLQKKYENLRLCLAHAGGVEGWFAKNSVEDQVALNDIVDLPEDPRDNVEQGEWNTSYAKMVYKLCLKFPNVYCDAAYLDEITDDTMYKHLKTRLKKIFAIEPKFAERIIYGSDWHMLFQEGKNNVYLDQYKRLFDEDCFTSDHRIKFFRNNALTYLKLEQLKNPPLLS
jgi:predicted TIM-barrel fold metal-dependent hydrolase